MLLAIVGPTGVGKTALSIALAKHFKAEIVNFDSMQVYEKLDIGTAKVEEEEKDGVIHHLLSFVPVDKDYSVYDYQKDSRRIIDKLIKEDKNIILVGGTGLYLKACLYDYKFTEEKERKDYHDLSNQELLDRIKNYDIEEVPHINNRKRLERLLEKLESNSLISKDGDKALYQASIIGLTCPRDILYERIDRRVDIMLNNGLLEEVESLKEYFDTSKALKTGIGYKEFIPYFNKKESLDEVIIKIKQNSRRYAKRQYTFFNHQLNVKWYEANLDNFEETIALVIKDLEK